MEVIRYVHRIYCNIDQIEYQRKIMRLNRLRIRQYFLIYYLRTKNDKNIAINRYFRLSYEMLPAVMLQYR